MGWGYDYKPYVPVAQRRAKAAREVAKLVKKGQTIAPVVIEGRNIVTTFWGKAWCTNLEGYSDFENRLPRGRTYVRNGSVVHMKIEKGRIEAFVSGSELYTVKIEITPVPRSAWEVVKKLCAGKIGSLVELLQGKLSKGVMEAVTDRADGLFPKPKEIVMRCSCPDYAGMCKHIAAVMYGIGNRLDTSPELLFELRDVNHQELIEQAIPAATARTKPKAAMIETADLGAIFDIEIDNAPPSKPPTSKPAKTNAAKVKTAPASAPAPEKKTAVKMAAKVKKAAKVTASPVKKTATPKKKAAKVTAAPEKKAAKVKKAAAPKKKTTAASKKK